MATSLPPGILDTIEAGDLVLYRDSAGRGLTLREVLDAKKKGTWESMRTGLYQPYESLPNIPYKLPKVALPAPSIPNALLLDAFNAQGISFSSNTAAPKMQPLIEISNERVPALYSEQFTSPEFLSEVLEGTEPGAVQLLLDKMFPFGLLDLDKEPTRLAAFSQSPRNVNASASIYAATRNVIMAMRSTEAQSPTVQRLIGLLEDIAEIARTHFFGTGSPLGQVGRLAVGFKISRTADALRRQSDVWNLLQTYQVFKGIQDKVRKISLIKTNDNYNVRPIALLASPQIQISDPNNDRTLDIQLVHITKTADAGFPWEGNAIKGDSIFGDILLLDKMWQHARDSETDEQSQQFSDTWAWTTLHKLKAKAEVYHIDKFNTKVRNISVPCNTVMLLPQMLLKLSKWFTATYQHPQGNKGCMSLMGYAPFHGGHDSLVQQIMQRNTTILHYADNLYIFEQDKFASIDISSMEAVHRASNIRNSLRYILESACGATFGESGNLLSGGHIGTTNAWLIYEWFGSLVTNSGGIIRSQQVKVPGLPSGMPGTFEFNDMLMACAADLVSHNPLSKNLLKVDGTPYSRTLAPLREMGMTTKVESHAPAPSSPSLTQAKSNPWTPLTEDPLFAKTDMLGFDTIFVDIGGNLPVFAVPTLNRERLVKALSFQKTDIRATPLGPTTQQIIQLATLNILYLTGAWAHADTAMAIEIAARSIMSEISLADSVSDLNDANASSAIVAAALTKLTATVDAEGTIDESMAKGILRSMLGSGLIPLTEVMRIVKGQEAAEQLDKLCVENISAIGPRLLRYLGPVRIGEIQDKIRATGASWGPPTLSAAARALERLIPLGPQAGNAESLDTTEQPPPEPSPPQPETSRKRKRPEATFMTSREFRRFVNRNLPPGLGPHAVAEGATRFLVENWTSTQTPIELLVSNLEGSDLDTLARAISQNLKIPLKALEPFKPRLGILSVTGAIEPIVSSRV